jgi:hypothetical protein
MKITRRKGTTNLCLDHFCRTNSRDEEVYYSHINVQKFYCFNLKLYLDVLFMPALKVI